MNGRRFAVATFGCKANTYDSGAIADDLSSGGWVAAAPGEAPDLVVVNSCTVTREADRQARKLVRRLRRSNPAARVVLTGCAAEIDPGRMARAEGVNWVVGNQDKHRISELLTGATSPPAGVLGGARSYGRMRPSHPSDRAWPEPEASFGTPDPTGGPTRVPLKVQEGCDAFCTFCIIPYARGPGRSLRPGAVIARVQRLVERGAREVVLTGTDLGSYGRDGGEASEVVLEDLVDAVLDSTGVERLRLTSLDPTEISERLLARMIDEPRLCPHVHVSLQSPHELILRRMKRRYRADDVTEGLERIARASTAIARRGVVGGLFVGMDVIAGFPGETEEIFEQTLRSLEALPWHRLHVFPYSERDGTAATRLDGRVDMAERRRRVRELMALSTARLSAHLESILDTRPRLDILVEGPVRGPDGTRLWQSGTTPGYLRVLWPDAAGVARGRVVCVPDSVFVQPERGDAALVGRLMGREAA